MVFLIGEKKLGRVICPDPWKSGARNTVGEQDFKLGGAILLDGWGLSKVLPYIPILVLGYASGLVAYTKIIIMCA